MKLRAMVTGVIAAGALLGTTQSLPAVAAPSDSGSEQVSAARSSCAKITRHRVTLTGLPNVQTYESHFATVKNTCKKTHRFTIDVKWYTDPNCKRIKPGRSTTFTWSIASYLPPGVGDPRRAKIC